MNKKNPRDVRGLPLTIRLTAEEDRMAKILRKEHNVNVSSLIRNTIRKEYEKVLQGS